MTTVPDSALASTPRRFGRFELRVEDRVLLADGVPVPIGARAFDVLVALSDRPGMLISKDALLSAVWPGLVVEENNLQVQVSTLRKLLGPAAVATIPGRGYRLDLAMTSDGANADLATSPSPDPLRDARVDETQPLVRTNLPPRQPSLYGRADDVAAIVALVREHALVTITGAGGIGKTRVAQAVAKSIASEAAHEYPDGVWWVELAALTDGALVPSAVAQVIGGGIEGERPTAAALQARLRGMRALLVLDNCEHLTDAVARLLETVMAGAPGVRVLVTSQETIKATDEHLYRLGGLAIADAAAAGAERGAVDLFEARARAVDPRFVLTPANLAGVIDICRRLDGIPLAIELAAARLPLLGVEGLRARLSERFALLTGGARVVLRRHQTLRATLEWSHSLLMADERTVFRRLGVFAGGFTLEAAQVVASDAGIDAWTTLDHLGALVDKSLVLAEGDAIVRYRMLETTRAYALERLAESGEMPAVLRRHAEAIEALLRPYERDESTWRATADIEPAAQVELDNLRAALEWADAAGEGALALALAAASYSVWWSSFHLAEGLSRCLALRRYVDATVSTETAARFFLTIAELGLYSIRRESYEAAVRAAALYRERGEHQRCFEALTFAAVQGARFASVSEMQAQIEEAGQLERPEWPARTRAKLQFARCFWFARQGRFEEALACAQRQVSICRDAGVEVGALFAMSNATLMQCALERPGEAVADARESIARLRALDADDGAGHLHFSELTGLLMLERRDEALVAARNAYVRLLHEGDQHRLLLPLALLHAQAGDLHTAARIAGCDQATQARSGENESVVAALFHSRLDPLLAAGLSADERAALAAQGAATTSEHMFSTALGEVTVATS